MNPRAPFYNGDTEEHRDSAVLEPKKAPQGWCPGVRRQHA